MDLENKKKQILCEFVGDIKIGGATWEKGAVI